LYKDVIKHLYYKESKSY